jgi:sulfate transport system permease protein
MAFVLLLPLVLVFTEAFWQGHRHLFAAFADRTRRQAIRLTLLVAVIAVPLNLVFGVAAAWAIAKFEFKGKAFLITLIDLPFSVSPVISGLVYVLLFGASSVLGPWLKAYNIEILFAVPGIVLATVFVTFPFVARELIPLMQDQGTGDEEARCRWAPPAGRPSPRDAAQHQMGPALWRAALQRPRHGRVRRCVGGFRPHPRQDHTMPLTCRNPLQRIQLPAAFAIASLLAMLALVTLVFKTILEYRFGDESGGDSPTLGASSGRTS